MRDDTAQEQVTAESETLEKARGHGIRSTKEELVSVVIGEKAEKRCTWREA